MGIFGCLDIIDPHNRELVWNCATRATRDVRGFHSARQLEERLQSPVWLDNDLVFTNSIGNTLCPTNVYRRGFKPLLRRAELPMIRLHDTRHTPATLLLLSGVHPKVVSEMLGHSSINITVNLYSHVLPDIQASATSAMERLL